nr:hypothetical protein CFP56_03761 [Quercus suber]
MPIYASILYAVGSLMAGTRMWLRATKQAGGLWWDDVSLSPATEPMMPGLTFRWQVMMLLAWFGSTMFFVVVILATERYRADRTLFHDKSSIAFKIAIYAGIVVTAGYSVAYILVLSFACLPSEAWWKAFNFTYEATANYSCLDTGTTWINVSCGVFAGGTDFYVIFLPWTMTQSLGLPKRQLCVLNFVFSLGVLATVASGFRTYYLYGIMCANAPAFRVFFRKFIVSTVQRSSYISSRTKSQVSANDQDDVALRRPVSNTSTMNNTTSFDFDDDIDPQLTVTKTGRVVFAPLDEAAKTPSEDIVRTPMDYEAYNMRAIETSRQMVVAR